MPGLKKYCHSHGKKRLRRTRYREIRLHEHDWYNLHRLADKLKLSLVDTVGVLVATDLRARGLEPMTAQKLAALGQNGHE